jgi:hypothetical protein
MRRAILITTLLLPFSAAAQTKLGIGMFTPELPFADAAARFAYIRGVAKHLATTLKMPVEGFAYKGATDYERDVHNHRLHFAILSPLYAASQRGTILAAARLRGGDPAWTLLAKTKRSLLVDLKGKILQVASMGPLTSDFLQNAILGGNIDLRKHFRLELAPDMNSAVKAVQLGRADVVAAYVNTPGLVPVIAGSLRMPPPALVLVDKKLGTELVNRVRAAVLSYGAVAATLEGWKAADSGAYSALAGSTRKRSVDMALVPVEALRFEHNDVVNAKRLEVRLPPLEDLFWLP